jgi:hypothetical protein
MPEKVIATQYYPSDLSHFLNIGEIVDMKVSDNGRGVKVLRIVSKPLDEDEDAEYRTVRASSRKLPSKPARKELPERVSKPSGPKKGIIGGALTTVFGDDYRNQRPPWMD